eukprot:CAMPEP_0117651294 /NCGR_PEP_ID=MMETSP0804-20121206/2014_1 /TAXON_ID=1074897 /ORGANISM="Tetraselmis astigmatica, Strain CCMP880" /LENGTH=213 /DNA_ID=CAMNT_0005457259 /DNA_START=299 /DNA_END=940 /DNA_ORIENTATION=+
MYFFVSDSVNLTAIAVSHDRRQTPLRGSQLAAPSSTVAAQRAAPASKSEVRQRGAQQLSTDAGNFAGSPVQELFQRVCGPGYSLRTDALPPAEGTRMWSRAAWSPPPLPGGGAAWEAAGGQASDLMVHMEEEADYDGLAVGWGINNKKQSALECAEACRNHRPGPHVGGPFQNLPCNAFVWCPVKFEVCFEPDAHKRRQVHVSPCQSSRNEMP